MTSQKQLTAAIITDDLETNIRREFYTFHCTQGPCLDASNSDEARATNKSKPLKYYNDKNKAKFIEYCNTKTLAKALLNENEDGITAGTITWTSNEPELKGINFQRTIKTMEGNENLAIIEYEARSKEKTLVYRKATLIPNAVHWCG